MQIELSVFGTGLGIIIDKIHAEFNEVWLAEAMKSAWSVWAELGWKCNKNMKVQKEIPSMNMDTKFSRRWLQQQLV